MHAVERAIAKIAGGQDNVITREQLLEAGLGRGAIEHRVLAGQAQRLHRGVYLIGPAPPTPAARARAAVLACGEGALLSHRSAAELLGLLPTTVRDVDVTVVARNPGVRSGIRLHRVDAIDAGDVVIVRRLAVTSPARTVCDVAGTEPSGEFERAFEQAFARRLITEQSLRAVIERAPFRRGSPVVRAFLRDPRDTRSNGERGILKLLKAAQLPLPLTNHPAHGYVADLLWPDERLVVEVDSRGYHGHVAAFERDRKRDQVMVAAGTRVLRVTNRQLEVEPFAVIARIAQALRADAPPAGL